MVFLQPQLSLFALFDFVVESGVQEFEVSKLKRGSNYRNIKLERSLSCLNSLYLLFGGVKQVLLLFLSLEDLGFLVKLLLLLLLLLVCNESGTLEHESGKLEVVVFVIFLHFLDLLSHFSEGALNQGTIRVLQ